MKIQKLIFKFKNLRKDKKIRKETKKFFIMQSLDLCGTLTKNYRK